MAHAPCEAGARLPLSARKADEPAAVLAQRRAFAFRSAALDV
jgi:hypothetical protein